eukprot:1159466-Pelagomonas_calceolata.AAC.6
MQHQLVFLPQLKGHSTHEETSPAATVLSLFIQCMAPWQLQHLAPEPIRTYAAQACNPLVHRAFAGRG